MEVYDGIAGKEYLKRLLNGVGRIDMIVVDGNVKWGKDICWVVKEELEKNEKKGKEVVVEMVGIGNDDEEDEEDEEDEGGRGRKRNGRFWKGS